MWLKPKGWKNLSAEDQAWMQGAKNLDKIQKLRACVKDNKPTRVLFLLNAHSFSNQEYYRTARLAVLERAPEALKALLEKNKGFNFADTSSGDRGRNYDQGGDGARTDSDDGGRTDNDASPRPCAGRGTTADARSCAGAVKPEDAFSTKSR